MEPIDLFDKVTEELGMNLADCRLAFIVSSFRDEMLSKDSVLQKDFVTSTYKPFMEKGLDSDKVESWIDKLYMERYKRK